MYRFFILLSIFFYGKIILSFKSLGGKTLYSKTISFYICGGGDIRTISVLLFFKQILLGFSVSLETRISVNRLRLNQLLINRYLSPPNFK